MSEKTNYKSPKSIKWQTEPIDLSRPIAKLTLLYRAESSQLSECDEVMELTDKVEAYVTAAGNTVYKGLCRQRINAKGELEPRHLRNDRAIKFAVEYAK